MSSSIVWHEKEKAVEAWKTRKCKSHVQSSDSSEIGTYSEFWTR